MTSAYCPGFSDLGFKILVTGKFIVWRSNAAPWDPVHMAEIYPLLAWLLKVPRVVL